MEDWYHHYVNQDLFIHWKLKRKSQETEHLIKIKKKLDEVNWNDKKKWRRQKKMEENTREDKVRYDKIILNKVMKWNQS